MLRFRLKQYARFALFLGFAAALEFCSLNPQAEPPLGGLNPQPEPPVRGGGDGGPAPGADAGTDSSDARDGAADLPDTGAATTPRTVSTIELLDEVKPITVMPPDRGGVSWPSRTRPPWPLDAGTLK